MRKNPKYLNIIAPITTWVMTIMAGTGFIVFYAACDSGNCERFGYPAIKNISRLSGCLTNCYFWLSISAAMAAMLTIMEGNGITFIVVMSVCLPASLLLLWLPPLLHRVKAASLKTMRSI